MNADEITIKTETGEFNVINLQPTTSKKLALVDFDTLQMLSKRLNTVGLNFIKDNLIEKIQDSKGLEEMVEVIRKEYNFHKAINLIDKYLPY